MEEGLPQLTPVARPVGLALACILVNRLQECMAIAQELASWQHLVSLPFFSLQSSACRSAWRLSRS